MINWLSKKELNKIEANILINDGLQEIKDSQMKEAKKQAENLKIQIEDDRSRLVSDYIN